MQDDTFHTPNRLGGALSDGRGHDQRLVDPFAGAKDSWRRTNKATQRTVRAGIIADTPGRIFGIRRARRRNHNLAVHRTKPVAGASYEACWICLINVNNRYQKRRRDPVHLCPEILKPKKTSKASPPENWQHPRLSSSPSPCPLLASSNRQARPRRGSGRPLISVTATTAIHGILSPARGQRIVQAHLRSVERLRKHRRASYAHGIHPQPLPVPPIFLA